MEHTFRLLIVREGPVSVEGDTNLATVCRFELLTVDFYGVGMRKDYGVTDAVRRKFGQDEWCEYGRGRLVGASLEEVQK